MLRILVFLYTNSNLFSLIDSLNVSMAEIWMQTIGNSCKLNYIWIVFSRWSAEHIEKK